ncbi:MAG TPA: PilN domain-containing protein [Firmicutes bacterium]|nr:PilN domain-containing protein [Bacillota bacterium]
MRDIDLTPRDRRLQRRVSSVQFAVIALLVAGTVFLGAEAAIYWWRCQEANAAIRRADSQIEAMAEYVRETSRLEKEIADMASYMATMQKLVANQVPWDEVVNDVAARLPGNVWLSKVVMEMNSVQLEGYAPSHLEVAQVVKEMGNSEWFKEVDLSKSEVSEISGRQMIKFLVTAYRGPRAAR